jgi:hypothetical protein
MKTLSTTFAAAVLALGFAACAPHVTPHDGGGGNDSGMTMDTGGPPPSDGGGDNCASASNCASCTAMGTCGWCANSGSCHAGTGMGATDGTCSGTNWAWLSSDCPGYEGGAPDNCAAATDCASCTAMNSCGWCGNAGSCHAGTGMGATDGTCMGTDWAWLSSDCTGGGGG